MSTTATPDRPRSGQVVGGDQDKDNSSEAPRTKRWAPRSRTGCLSCRRVKCDEARPKCKSCQKRNAKCHYELNPPGTGASSDALPRRSVHIRPKPAATEASDSSAGPVKCDEPPSACCVYSGLLSPEPETLHDSGESHNYTTASIVVKHGGTQQYHAAALPLSTSQAQSTRHQRRPARSQDITLGADILPPDWYYSESVTYCKFCPLPGFCCDHAARTSLLIIALVNTYLLRKISKFEAIPIKYHRPLGKNVANYDAFIAFILAYRITQISHDRGNLVQPSEAYRTKHLWERLYTCISNQITCINAEIARPHATDAAKIRVLTRIQGIKCVELMLQSPIWRNHMEGFLSLLRFCGGAKFAQGHEGLIKNSKGMLMEAILANSVAPPDNQILGTSAFTTEELLFFHGQILHPSFPCPTYLFEGIIETNNLRVKMHSDPSLGHFTAALTILQRIDAFQPTAWTEAAYELPNIPEVPLMASVYQLAVGLFCLMALQYAGLGSLDKAERRSSLLALLKAAWKLEHCRDALNWPLAVAGCALADGGTLSDQAFICQCLQDAAQHVFAVHPLVIIARLRRFWTSGMTHWDKCWDEPCPIIG
ncbi:C6 finger domain [Cordyceps militaris]|uniref:C6 finger domain n=1 Tax=Cordyceps militaris TaxID=73501 RepID=A0A2H4SED7_CORMI|nr:C6 finger domain [Cordyceps militaris]